MTGGAGSGVAALAGDGAPASHRRAYERELRPLLCQRIRLNAATFVTFVGLAVIAEAIAHPARRPAVVGVYAIELVACALAVVGSWIPGLRDRPTVVGSVFGATLAALLALYAHLVRMPGEVLAMAHLVLLSGLFVLIPWGWRPQLGVALGAAVSYALVGPEIASADAGLLVALAVFTGTVTSVLGAHFLDRYRFDAFVRATLLTRASAATQEEGEINAALLRITESLQANLEQPAVMMSVLNQLARRIMDCDYSNVFLWDPERRALRLHASAGMSKEITDLLLDADLTIEAFPAIEELFSRDSIEVADANQQDMTSPDFLRSVSTASLLSVSLRRGETFVGLYVAGRSTRTGAFTPRQRRLAAGIAHAAAVALDNARLILELQNANRLKSQFVSTVSHELRTPLNVILGYAEIAQDGSVPDSERARCLARITGAGRELLGLIESTLETGRLEAGRSVVQLVPVALSEFWTALGEGCGAIPRRETVRLEWVDGVPARTVQTDAQKLAIVVRNLVGNAVKFTDRGTVRARLQVEPEAVVVQVSDTGIGIRPEDQQSIFEMFRQADGSDTRRFGGTGLGLYLVRQFVAQLRGTVTVESAVGVGSTFTVRVPVVDA